MDQTFDADRRSGRSVLLREDRETHSPATVRETCEAIALTWNLDSLPYAVAHGLDEYPESVGRDLDVLVERGHEERALSIALDVLAEAGFVATRPDDLWGPRLLAFRESQYGSASIEIHVVTKLSWGSVVFARRPQPGTQNGPFKIDPWVSFAKRVLLPLLRGNREQIHSRIREMAPAADERAAVEKQLQAFCGVKVSENLLRRLERGDAEELLAFRPALRRSLVWRSLYREPGGCVAGLAEKVRRGSLARFKPCVPIVAIVGPDGVGKSTTLRELEAVVPSVIQKTVFRHWRPGLLPNLSRLRGVPEFQPGTPVPPRRTPGRFAAARLGYYFLDYVLGHYFQDAPLSATQKLLIYDRCALDMVVDPVRYGLSSKRGARLLWRFVPKPDLVVLLYDTPDRILRRKAELPREEIQEQLKSWLDLARQGEVDAVVQVDAGPEVVAARINDLIVEALIRRNGGYVRPEPKPRGQGSLRWIGSILAGDKNHAGLFMDGESPEKANGLRGQRKVTQFGLLPACRKPRFLIPIGGRKVLANALTVYKPQKFSALLARRIASAGLQSKLARRFALTTASLWAEPALENLLKDVLKVKEVHLSVSLGKPGIHQKPTIQVMNAEGEVLAYAKVGWNPQTVSLVQTEAAVLQKVSSGRFSTAATPRVLHDGWWNDFFVLVQEGPAPGAKSSSQVLQDEHIRFLTDLNLQFRSHKGSWHGWKTNLLPRIDLLEQQGFSYYAYIMRQAVEHCASILSQQGVPLSLKHGDFAPWNVVASNSKLFVFDWEYANEISVPGWDAFHFIVQTGVLVKRESPERIRQEILGPSATAERVRQLFEGLDIPAGAVPALLGAYLVEVLEWGLRFDGRRASRNQDAFRRTWRHLLTHSGPLEG